MSDKAIKFGLCLGLSFFISFFFVCGLSFVYGGIITIGGWGDGYGCDVCGGPAKYTLTIEETGSYWHTVEKHEFCEQHAKIYVYLNQYGIEDVPSDLESWRPFGSQGLPYTLLIISIFTMILFLFLPEEWVEDMKKDV